MKRNLLLIFFSLAFTLLSAKGKLVKCGGTYTYIYSTSVSLDEAKAQALEYAITRAIADELGTAVKSESYIEIVNTQERFDQVSRLLVKGKWVKDIHAPKFSDPVFGNNLFSVDVTVSFYAQPLESAPVAFTAHVLRNGTEDKFESDLFYGDEEEKLYVSFLSPKAGYVAIYLEDTENVYCALPYFGDDDAPFYAKKGERYVFFNVKNNTYHLECGAEPEVNFVHIVFSPHKFIDGDLVREMPRRKFREWLGTAQSYDEKMQVQSTMIRVRPKP